MPFFKFKKSQSANKGSFNEEADWGRFWTQRYLHVQAALALEKIGFWELVLRGEKKPLSAVATELGVDVGLLRACVEFLWAATDFLERVGDDTYIVRWKEVRDAPLLMISAYKDILDNMAALMSGTKRYGADVSRDGFYLQAASDLFIQKNRRHLIDSLSEEDAQLIDLGCGSAQSLIEFCRKQPLRTGLGIDVDHLAVRAAQAHVDSQKFSERIRIVESDARDIDEWKKYTDAQKKKIFLSSFVMHEFLRDGEQFFVELLKKFADAFPGSRFLLFECDLPPAEEIKSQEDLDKRLFFARYRLWHYFSNQGIPQPQKVWKKFFEKSGWRLNSVTHCFRGVLIYDCEF